LVLTIGVGQVGIDLSKARHAIFSEISYTPTELDQARMRTFSPDRPMTETFILCDHAVDYRLVITILRKCDQGRDLGVPAAALEVDILKEAFELEEPDLEAVVLGL